MEKSRPVEFAAEIVAAFVSNNSVPTAELPALIEAVHAAVKRLADGEVAPPVIELPVPAVSIRKSVTPDYLICLEDGKRFKSLRRHLSALGMTPEQYRAKWNLPSTYPMIAPNYSAQRSASAKNLGLGLRGKPVAALPASAGESEAAAGTIKVPVSVAAIEVTVPEPTSVAKTKSKGKGKRKAVAAPPPKSPGKRKAARPR